MVNMLLRRGSGRFSTHPARKGLKAFSGVAYKNRQASYEDIKQAQQVKKLRKKRRKGR
ncbi:hypothetical protein [Streptococcus sp. zg-JUN1979]|uniref:hypothetical protein n=1 Tax=Streptococcus sp. zg-JUN1979 TaxID=3391450 RepID=UPI0039A776FD